MLRSQRLKAKQLVLLNNIPKFNNNLFKTDYDAKISDNENKNFTTSDYNKFSSEILGAMIKKIGKELDNDLDKKIATLARKAELKAEQNKLPQENYKNIIISSFFIGESYFRSDESQNFLVFLPI